MFKCFAKEFSILALAFFTGVLGIWIGQSSAEQAPNLRTICIGRYLVDVPENLEILEHYGSVGSVLVEVLGPGSPQDLERLFDRRIMDLRQGRAYFQSIPLIYKDHRSLADVKIVAYRADSTALGTTFADWTEEAYVSRGGRLFRLEKVVAAEAADVAQAELIQVARAVRPREDTEIPTGDGTCLPGAFVSLPPVSEVAGATIGVITESGALGLQFSFVQRSPQDPLLIIDTRFRNSHSEVIEIAGYPGEQLLLDQSSVNFGAIAGQASGPDTWGHLIRVEFYDQRSDTSQNPFPSVYSRGVWQSVLQSIRHRAPGRPDFD